MTKLIAITGGMGCGKSTILSQLKFKGFFTYNSDTIIKETIYKQDANAIKELAGKECLDVNNEIVVSKFSAKLYANPQLYNTVSDIVLERLKIIYKTQLRTAPIVFVEVPFLYEYKLESFFDRVICIHCSRANQLDRLYQRGLTDEQIAARELHHIPLPEKLSRTPYLICTDSVESSLTDLNKIILAITT